MKKLVALLACTVIATSAFAQGTVNFTNLKPTKQILTDAAGAKLEGAWAQLYAGKAADSLSAVGSPVALYEGKKAGDYVGILVKGSCLGTIEQVSELLFYKLNLPRNKINLIKGWFQDTIPAYRDKVGNIAILRLDGDWYESTKIPLENLYTNISPGGYVIIDDYATCFGSKKAVDEFIEKNSIDTYLRPDYRGGAWFKKPS